MTIITFEMVSMRGNKTIKCDKCGKRLQRAKKFWQTLSQFNRTKDGDIKDAQMIRRELMVECNKWKDAPERCKDCI